MNKNDLMFSMLLHVSTNMWNDRDAVTYKKLPKETVDHLVEDLNMNWEQWDKVINFLPQNGFNSVLLDMGDAVIYDRHPELAIRGSMKKDEFKKVLDRLRAVGLTPIPKLNFSACHDAWLKDYSLMIGTPEYMQTCLDCIDEMAELFDYPEYFHLGLDEECYHHQRNLGIAIVRSNEEFWKDAYTLFDRCGHHNMRPWVWSDFYWHHPESFIENMPKSVLQSNWYYEACSGKNPDGTYKQTGMQAYLDLDRLGYDQVPTGSIWYHERNVSDTIELAKNELDPRRLKGYLSAPWYFFQEQKWLLMMQEAVYVGTAKKKYFG